jgi:hypothetical protein
MYIVEAVGKWRKYNVYGYCFEVDGKPTRYYSEKANQKNPY